jgi:hypothetical protein
MWTYSSIKRNKFDLSDGLKLILNGSSAYFRIPYCFLCVKINILNNVLLLKPNIQREVTTFVIEIYKVL